MKESSRGFELSSLFKISQYLPKTKEFSIFKFVCNNSSYFFRSCSAVIKFPVLKISSFSFLFVTDTSRHFINASDMYPVPDTLEYGNRMYKLISGNFTWSSALQACMANSAELVSITDQYHQAFLTIIVNRLGYSHWIGLFTSDVCRRLLTVSVMLQRRSASYKLMSCVIDLKAQKVCI